MPDHDRRATFIVRLWRERGTPAGQWRGEVAHVQSARLAHFNSPDELLGYVWSELRTLEMAPATPTPGVNRPEAAAGAGSLAGQEEFDEG